MIPTPTRWFRCLLLRGTAESGALKANALPGGARRLAVRAVKGAQCAFIGAKRETLDRRSARSIRQDAVETWNLPRLKVQDAHLEGAIAERNLPGNRSLDQSTRLSLG